MVDMDGISNTKIYIVMCTGGIEQDYADFVYSVHLDYNNAIKVANSLDEVKLNAKEIRIDVWRPDKQLRDDVIYLRQYD